MSDFQEGISIGLVVLSSLAWFAPKSAGALPAIHLVLVAIWLRLMIGAPS